VPEVLRGIAYGPLPEQRLDLYLPSPREALPRPAVLSLHGGGWQGGDRGDPRMVARVARPLAERGYAVAAASYRRAPAHRFPAQLEDAALAIRWLRESAADHGIDPARLGAVGGSSGGHLAALLGTSAAAGETGLRGVVCLLAPADLSPPGWLDRVADPDLRSALARIVRDLLGVSWEEDPSAWRRASPLDRASSGSVPFFLLPGRDDEVVPVDQALRFAAALARHGVEVETEIVDGLGHDVDASPAISARVDAALARAWRFLDRHVSP